MYTVVTVHSLYKNKNHMAMTFSHLYSYEEAIKYIFLVKKLLVKEKQCQRTIFMVFVRSGSE